jgi:Pyridoxamine 5'-phosphate oxidase
MGHQAAQYAGREMPVTAEPLQSPPASRPWQAAELTEGECWRLLASVSIGRVVFTQRAMPAIRPVNHVIDGRTIIIGTHLGAAITARTSDGRTLAGSVVCYEADDLDPARRAGWSVIVTGMARLVTDPAVAGRYAAAVEPWIDGDLNQVVAIEPQFVSGIRLAGRRA